jgi:hypothetical protein
MAIIPIHRMPVLPMVITGRAISITVFSWEWVLGDTGVTPTAGVISAITREGMAVVTRHHRPMVEGNRPTAVVADHPVEVEANRQVVAVVVGPQASGRLRAC